MCADCPALLAADLDGAFPTLLGHHQDLVFGMAMRLSGQASDAEDLAQETFVRAYGALRGYEAERIRALHTRGWLAAIVHNLARDRARRRRWPDAATMDEMAAAIPDAAPGPEALVTRREEALAWRRRLDALPPRLRRAVELRHVDGLDYQELAVALGRPVGTVKSDVHRGVRLLRAALVREADGPERGRGARGPGADR